jgi:predicted outer membrane repeat protein
MFLEKSLAQTGDAEIPEGFGTVTVSLTQGAARTVIPEIDLSAVYPKYLFVKDGDTAIEKTPTDGKFVLEPGNYSLTVEIYADGAKENLAAQGTTEADFFISAGVDAGTVSISLRPVASGNGIGDLDFSLSYPAGATVETFTLTLIAGGESPLDLASEGNASGADPVVLSGAKAAIPVGYYLLRVALKDGGGASAGRTEVVHIYRNLKAVAEYVFIADDFRAYRVTTNADSGLGSLRQALTDAQAMSEGPQLLRVLLEPGAVIVLENALPAITKNLIIEGNGVTLTRVASWLSSGGDHRLLRITGNTTEVHIRRVHFKDGLSGSDGGAIYTTGILALESCIFSGNRTDSIGAGGAIYSTNTMTIRGCTFYGNTAAYNAGAVQFDAQGKTLTLTGNVFYGNTAQNEYPVLQYRGITSPSYNLTDVAFGVGNNQTGWHAITGNTVTSVMPVSGKTFRLLSGSEAAAKLPNPLPTDYPLTDFYGNPISAGGAVGAVQESAANQGGYYYLGTSVNNSLGGNLTVSVPPDADGLYPAGSTITVDLNSGYTVGCWLVNGVKTTAVPTSLSAHTIVRAIFSHVITVDIFTDEPGSATIAGTLRYALTNAQDGDLIAMSGVSPGLTMISLKSALPVITKSLVITGNGITLTRAASWTSNDYDSQLLKITNVNADVLIQRVHFKDGLANNGGAVYTVGILTLESCIFSGNRATSGGALYSTNTLNIRGCTFYGNTAHSGGVVYYWFSKTLTLTGNVFYGNTVQYRYPVVYNYNTAFGTVSASYNIVDTTLGTGDTQTGWAAGTGDIATNAPPVSGLTIKLLYGSAAAARLPTPLPVGFPDTDFYGNPVSDGGAAGAVQESTANQGGYYYLETSVNNSLGGSLSVSNLPDVDGLYPAGSTITANLNSGYTLRCWLVNGAKTGVATVSLSAHSFIRAIFDRVITVNLFTDEPGSETVPGTLRYALTNAEDGDLITITVANPGTDTIELKSPLPVVTKSLVIEGNGITLTRATSWTGSDGDSQLLRITDIGVEVMIRRVCFKDGMATDHGGAIYNMGILSLESCIFSGNRTTGNGAYGGALYNNNTLTISGCTFYGNTANSYGGVVWFSNSGRTLTMTGNLFYGNMAPNGYPVVYKYLGANGTIIASYNVADTTFGIESTQTGWREEIGDTVITSLPVSGKSFRLLSGSGAAARLPTTLPEDYPDTDFYGNPISAGGAAGAVQGTTANQVGYYYLETSMNNSLGGSVTVSPVPDADGLCPAGSTITANLNSGYIVEYWLVNGAKIDAATVSLSTHSFIRAIFSHVITVDIFTDLPGSATTVGTLRYALTNADTGDFITMTVVNPGTDLIELESPLPVVTKSLTIEGNGVTLTRAASWTGSDGNSQLLRITDADAEVMIRRVHFRNGLANNEGGAIYNRGILNLESCIFSGNRTTNTSASGGAIYTGNTLTIRGCTFYGNAAGYGGEAVWFSNSTKILTMTGNLFYGNMHGTDYPMVYKYLGTNGTITASYNVADTAFETSDSGWVAGTGDTVITSLPVSGKSFRLLSGSGAAARLPTTLPEDYPDTDFYGNPVNAGGAAGAVQETTANQGGYYYLETSMNNSLRGNVTVSNLPDADGLYPAGSTITITAGPNGGYVIGYWLVNGVPAGTMASLNTSISAHSFVRVIFSQVITVNLFTDGPGSATMLGTLRYALTNANEDDLITLTGVMAGSTTIELESSLPEILRSLTIAGNGVTLTRAASWTSSSSSSQLLRIPGRNAEVTIRRVHFKDGLATDGGAIDNMGILTLESCIFSGNLTTDYGGALWSSNTLSIRGCTFYGNTSSYRGGAVQFTAAPGTILTLAGNLFYGNTAPNGPVLYSISGTVDTSYNVVDADFGTGSTQTGWYAGNGDTRFTTLNITGDPFNTTTFAPVTALQTVLTTAPAGFPATDFYDANRTFPGAPGAVK